jgi:phage/plasmid-like protein (TIGR03299 family)
MAYDIYEVLGGGRVNREHGLMMVDGVAAMAYQGETPWHQLGTRTKAITSVEQALEAGKIDYTVSTRPTYYEDPTTPGSFIKIPDRQAILRDGANAYLATVGNQYAPIQNRPGFMVLQTSIEKHGFTIESVGAVDNGARAWMLVKMKDVLTPVPGDDVRGYMLVQCVHDGSGSYIVKPTPVRAVCRNTLAVALAGSRNFISLVHKKTPAQQLDVVERTIEQVHVMMEQTGKNYADLAQRPMNLQELGEFIETVFPNPDPDKDVSPKLTERRNTVAKLTFFGKGAQMAGSNIQKGTTTAWAAYNAITEYIDHVRPAEAIKPTAKVAANNSALFGTGDQVKLAALKQALQLVAA